MNEIIKKYSEENASLPDYVNTGRLEQTLGENQVYALRKKYLKRNELGEIIESPAEAIYRMAYTMASIEKDYGKTNEEINKFTKEFYDIISNGYFSPAGRIWTNAGTDTKALFNCYVLPVDDNIELIDGGVFMQVAKAAVIHKNGGGTGYNFSKLRPRGTYVKKSKGIASGPVSFIGQFDKETEIINSGNRRGANMGILNVNHPDILDFIYSKTKRGELKNFNVSVGIFDDFMKAVEQEDFYQLKFPEDIPFTEVQLEQIVKNIEENKIGGSDVGKAPRPSSLRFSKDKKLIIDSYSGEISGRIKNGNVELYAPYVFETISKLAWETADPGIIFLDEINKYNSLPGKGPIEATNPCGEQPLHPYDACNLGSIIISNFIVNKNNKPEIDYDQLEKPIKIATRFMDNVNDVNEGPIKEIEETVKKHRRIGMGIMGWATALSELGIPYDSEEAYQLARNVMKKITETAKKSSVELANEKGVFPAFEESKYNNGNLEDRVRNLERTTIAPTGTISMVYDVSSGIEPLFGITYRKKIRGGDVLLYTIPSFTKEAEKRGLDMKIIAPLIEANHGSVQGIKEIPEDLQNLFKTAHDISYKDHIKMQAAFQEFTDNSVSKTINMPETASVEDIKNAYFLAWKNNLKGITVYRDKSKDVQVLETGHKDKKIHKSYRGTIEHPVELPGIMPTVRIKQKTPFGNMFVNIVIDPYDNYRAVEIFGAIGDVGEQESSTMEYMGKSTSMWLRSGGDLANVIHLSEKLGSGNSISTRGGSVKSLEMGFAKACIKFEIAKKKASMEDILTGKIDLDKFDGEVEDIVRKYSDEKGKWRTYDSSNNEKENDLYSENELLSKKNTGKNSAFKLKCPTDGCAGRLIHEDGCTKCYTCGYSTC